MQLTAQLVYWQGRARERYGRLTPWRLGAVVGQAGKDLPNPYEPGKSSRGQFEQGVAWGKAQAARQAARLGKPVESQ